MFHEKHRRYFPAALTLMVGVLTLAGGKFASDLRDQREIEEYLTKNQPIIADGQDSYGMEGLLPDRPFTRVIEESSNAILIGNVVKIDEPYSKLRGQVYHNVHIRPEKTLKNTKNVDLGEDVTVEVYGGELNGDVYWTLNEPTFFVGEKVLVFLTEGIDAPYHVTYGVFGKLTIENGMVTGINEEDGLVRMTLDAYERKIDRLLQK